MMLTALHTMRCLCLGQGGWLPYGVTTIDRFRCTRGGWLPYGVTTIDRFRCTRGGWLPYTVTTIDKVYFMHLTLDESASSANTKKFGYPSEDCGGFRKG